MESGSNARGAEGNVSAEAIERYRLERQAAARRCLLTEVAWPVVRDAIERGAGIIVPVGSIEQHGYHMPLSTDLLLVTELAVCAADRLGYLVAPPSNYGFRSRPLSGGGPTYPGTISVGATALIAYLTDVLDDLVRHGFKRIVLMSMHLENTNMLWEAAWQTIRGREQEGLRIMVVEQGFASISQRAIDILFGDEFPGWAVEHAAVMETSLMLYLRPDLVDMEAAVDDQAKRTATYEVLPVPQDMITASGGLWKATLGTAEKGVVVWEELVDYMEGAIRAEMA
jgi:creatinine amidohydrolase